MNENDLLELVSYWPRLKKGQACKCFADSIVLCATQKAFTFFHTHILGRLVQSMPVIFVWKHCLEGETQTQVIGVMIFRIDDDLV